jgi:hypothetical protein
MAKAVGAGMAMRLKRSLDLGDQVVALAESLRIDAEHA